MRRKNLWKKRMCAFMAAAVTACQVAPVLAEEFEETAVEAAEALGEDFTPEDVIADAGGSSGEGADTFAGNAAADFAGAEDVLWIGTADEGGAAGDGVVGDNTPGEFTYEWEDGLEGMDDLLIEEEDGALSEDEWDLAAGEVWEDLAWEEEAIEELTEASGEDDVDTAEEAWEEVEEGITENADLLEDGGEESSDDTFFENTDVVYDAATMSPFAGRTEQDVADAYGNAQLVAKTYKNGNSSTWYETVPSLKAPYAAGKLTENTHAVMTAMQDLYRWLAGAAPLSAGSYHTESLQHQALDRCFEWDHYISQSSKPEDMDQELWDIGFNCTHNVLSWGTTPKSDIGCWVNEGYSKRNNSWDTLGHRYFMIGQNISQVLYGHVNRVGVGQGKYGNSIPSTQAFTAFPAPGYMPNNLIDPTSAAWNFELNRNCVTFGKLSDLTVRVTDLETNESYLCTSGNGGLFYSSSYKLIGFIQPDLRSGSSGSYTGEYQVDIIGLKDVSTGTSAGITYRINFLDVRQKAPSRLEKISSTVQKPCYVPYMLGDTDGLKKVAAMLPKETVATAASESGISVPLSIMGCWEVDEANQCFVAKADLSAVPANWEIPEGLDTTVTIRYQVLGENNAYNRYNNLIMTSGDATLSDTHPAHEGDSVQMSIYTSRGSILSNSRICAIGQNEEGAYLARTVFDSATTPEECSWQDGVYHRYMMTVSTEDAGAYLGIFYGSATGPYYITNGPAKLYVKKGMEKAKIAPIADMTYTGKPITPTLNVTYNGTVMQEGTDYTVSLADNTVCGEKTAKVTLTGMGIFDGTLEGTFSILPRQIREASMSQIQDEVYDGTSRQPAVTLTYEEQELAEGIDFEVSYGENINAGTGTLTISGKGNFAGSRQESFTIAKKNIGELKAEPIDPVSYTGKKLKPAVQIGFNGKNLISGKDYTAVYSDNVHPGQALVTVTGKGNFTGTLTASFAVLARQISLAGAEAVDACVYNGEAHTPIPVITDGKKELQEGTDYTLAYGENTKAGAQEGLIRVLGKGDYQGEKQLYFAITAASLQNGFVLQDIDAQTYAADGVKPAVVVTDGTKVLVRNVDYSVSYSANDRAGEGVVLVTGTGNYKDTITGTFEIKARDLSSLSFSSIGRQIYTGKEITPQVIVRDGTKTLAQGTDFEVVYEDNIEEGTASVRITGKGNYEGQKTLNFTIDPVPVQNPGYGANTNTNTGNQGQAGNGAGSGANTGNQGQAGNGAGSGANADNQSQGGNGAGSGAAPSGGAAAAEGTTPAAGTTVVSGEGGTQLPAAMDKPAVPAVQSLKVKKGRKAVFTWQAAEDADGYEIQYAYRRSMKGARTVQAGAGKTSVTLKKLKKGQKIYVRIRAYKVKGGSRQYSAWSKKKSVKVKK